MGDTKAVRVLIITGSDIQRCPKKSMHPEHYQEGGSCLCSDREAAEDAVKLARDDAARAKAVLADAHERLRRT